MKKIETLLEKFEENKTKIYIIERWYFDESKKPKKKWAFRKEEEITTKNNGGNDITTHNLMELKEYKSKQAAYKRLKKEMSKPEDEVKN